MNIFNRLCASEAKSNGLPLSRVIAVALVLSATGCASDDVDGSGLSEEEDGAAPTSALVGAPAAETTAQSNAEIFKLRSGNRDIALRPVQTHACFLTTVSGNLAGGADGVAVHRNLLPLSDGDRGYRRVTDDLSAYWNLASYLIDAKNSLYGEATCVPLANFYGEPGMVTMQSGHGWGLAESRWPGCSETAHADMWYGDAVSYVSGLAGNFEGGGELAEIITGEPDTPSVLRVRTENCGEVDTVEAIAYSLFVGKPGESVTWRTQQVKLDAGKNSRKEQRLMRTTDGVCYFTRISGNFDGGGERARIYPQIDESGTEWWMLEAKAEGGSAYSTAECIFYNQHDGCVKPGVPCL